MTVECVTKNLRKFVKDRWISGTTICPSTRVSACIPSPVALYSQFLFLYDVGECFSRDDVALTIQRDEIRNL